MDSRRAGGLTRSVLAVALAATLAVLGWIGNSAMAAEQAADQPADRATDRAADREQIAAILVRWENAWNQHDMSAFGSMFHEDGVWILWTGDVWYGRKTIEDGHAAVHKTIFRTSIQRERLEELRFTGEDAAVVRFCSMLTGDERAPEKVIRSRKFLVVTRDAGAWKVAWGQNTRLADSVPDSECFVELRQKLPR